QGATAGPRDPATLTTRRLLGSFYMSQGHYADAEKTLLELLIVQRQAMGVGHPTTVSVIAELGRVYDRVYRANLAKGRTDDAKKAARQCVELYKEWLDALQTRPGSGSGSEFSIVTAILAVALASSGEYDRAVETFEHVGELQRVGGERVQPETEF